MRRLWPILGLGMVAVALVLAAPWLLLAPSHDRDWQPVYGRVAQVTPLPDGRVRLSNIRDWSYAPDGQPTAQTWIARDLDPAQLRRVWFVMEPFSKNPAIAHTMLSFEFADGAAYVASVEARREIGEPYSALRAALLPTHEYLWVWTTERDAYGNSTWFTEDALYLYALALTPAEARAILREVLADTADVAANPRWYHTLAANCTNVLARTVNKTRPDAVPLDVAWLLPGYADSFLHRLGYIAPGRDFTTAETAAHITPLIPAAYTAPDPTAFSRRLRAAMAAQDTSATSR
ncbi:uncharacterized protein DUF4105 [Rhodovulum adriaticum]|uniref:Uncharacterized protein DUF4105 n=2 Tax=Rhodovulum adriaticum TaxID=35804 RepID=A0A4R2NV37_RHOAD|nr:uncharacterized protein DUF4105 [Rhodovulum adriaticum]